jgi:phosphoserine phosphatase RsbU/P
VLFAFILHQVGILGALIRPIKAVNLQSLAMDSVDVSDNPRIAILMRMTAALEQSRAPYETLQIIRRGFWEAYGASAAMILSTRGLQDGEFRVLLSQLTDETLKKYFEPQFVENIPVQRGGVMAEIIRQRRPKIVQNVDWSSDPNFSQTLCGYDSVVAIPANGVRLPIDWLIFLKRPPEKYVDDDLEQAILRTSLVRALLETQTMAEELKTANGHIEEDIRQLSRLQRSLLPDPLPTIPGLEIAVSYEPSGRAGGDLYDIFPCGQNAQRWCIFIGDASGHGAAAAVVMAIVQAILHTHPLHDSGPAEILAYANDHLCRRKIGGFVTAFLGVYEPATRELAYANAGHPPPIIKPCPAGPISLLNSVASYPLGIDFANRFNEATIKILKGDAILLYTDGITEARSPDRSLFELDRLEREFASCGQKPKEIVQNLRYAVSAFEQGRPSADDQTFVVLKSC